MMYKKMISFFIFREDNDCGMSTIYIPLGSACGLAYQLQNKGLRICSFPFDWLRIDNLRQISNCLKDKFNQFLELKTVDESTKFPVFDDDQFPIEYNPEMSIIKENIYGMKFYHDFKKSTQLSDVYIKYKRRIDRFYEALLNANSIVFIRDELKPNKLSSQDILEFINVIKSICKIGIELVIVINNPRNKIYPVHNIELDNVRIINDVSKYQNWQRSILLNLL